jgi:predicted nucleic acid-binding protein
MILMDAGPLVAILHQDDRHHERCVATLQSLRDPVGTTWPVLSEAMHLLRFSWAAQDALWDLIATEALRLIPIDITDVPRMRQLMQKYRDLPMDLADAALVRVAERESIRRIFTTDRRDFARYRPAKIGRFEILP